MTSMNEGKDQRPEVSENGKGRGRYMVMRLRSTIWRARSRRMVRSMVDAAGFRCISSESWRQTTLAEAGVFGGDDT